MSMINASIIEIQSVDNLNIVSFDFSGTTLKMMSLDLSDEMQVGRKVILNVKPFHITIVKEFYGEISYSNKLNAVVQSYENGELLSSVKLLVNGVVFESIITKELVLEMELKIGDNVIVMIKASDLFIQEIADD
ncbi:MAG: transporter [Epsilonproteobacteria bacterium]|nr:MAG: transporter [Campylobacterota bacterium]